MRAHYIWQKPRGKSPRIDYKLALQFPHERWGTATPNASVLRCMRAQNLLSFFGSWWGRQCLLRDRRSPSISLTLNLRHLEEADMPYFLWNDEKNHRPRKLVWGVWGQETGVPNGPSLATKCFVHVQFPCLVVMRSAFSSQSLHLWNPSPSQPFSLDQGGTNEEKKRCRPLGLMTSAQAVDMAVTLVAR